MTFGLRVALLTGTAVAVAAIGAAALMYVVVQTQLTGQIDQTLADAAALARQSEGGRPGPDRPFRPGGVRAPLGGRPDIYGQVIDATGAVLVADTAGGLSSLVTAETRAVAAGRSGAQFFNTTTGDGTHVRAYVTPLRPGQALVLARQTDEIERVLDETRVRLGLLAFGGVITAALLGAIVTRGALTPVRHLTALVGEVSRTKDLSRRVTVGEADELGRLAASFNEMLAALEASVRSQRQLVADASHELRTPLTSLRTNLELLARGQPADPEERREVLTDLVGQMERLSGLVSDLIDLAREEEGALPVEDVRLDEVVAETLDDVRTRYPAARFVLERRPTTVRGVRSRIARAVTNLLDNAGKWSPAGGAIEVSVSEAEVAVRDHGPGVDPDDAPHVFDRFWRAAGARQLPGSGLGLAIVKDVAESHGGSVALEHPSGGGALFRLRFARS